MFDSPAAYILMSLNGARTWVPAGLVRPHVEAGYRFTDGRQAQQYRNGKTITRGY